MPFDLEAFFDCKFAGEAQIEQVHSKVNSVGDSYLRPSNIISPFIARIGLKVDF